MNLKPKHKQRQRGIPKKKVNDEEDDVDVEDKNDDDNEFIPKLGGMSQIADGGDAEDEIGDEEFERQFPSPLPSPIHDEEEEKGEEEYMQEGEKTNLIGFNPNRMEAKSLKRKRDDEEEENGHDEQPERKRRKTFDADIEEESDTVRYTERESSYRGSPGGPIPVPAGPAPVPGGPVPVPAGPIPVPAGPIPVPAGPTPIPAGPVQEEEEEDEWMKIFLQMMENDTGMGERLKETDNKNQDIDLIAEIQRNVEFGEAFSRAGKALFEYFVTGEINEWQ
ncbi:MAG: hypothetical protein JRG71_15090 [Deltaproteobacteria bacterium]|nr:hypothetical protein [Deltaproteobacteria bacterium]